MTNAKAAPLPPGLIQDLAEIEPLLHQSIAKAIPLDQDAYSYPEYFSEFVRTRLKRAPGKVLVLAANAEIGGDLDLDAAWNGSRDITAIVAEGDLTVHGDVVNADANDGPMLFVAGTLAARNVVKGGAYFLVLGDMRASGVVVGDYNDGVIRVGGRIAARATLSIDHDIYARKGTEGPYYHLDETIWEDVLAPEVLDEGFPSVDLILAHLRAGRSILLEE